MSDNEQRRQLPQQRESGRDWLSQLKLSAEDRELLVETQRRYLADAKHLKALLQAGYTAEDIYNAYDVRETLIQRLPIFRKSLSVISLLKLFRQFPSLAEEEDPANHLSELFWEARRYCPDLQFADQLHYELLRIGETFDLADIEAAMDALYRDEVWDEEPLERSDITESWEETIEDE